MKHTKDCNWTKANCEYKDSHEYCPHQEHSCNCSGIIEPQSCREILEKYGMLPDNASIALKQLTELVYGEKKLFNPNSTYSEGYAKAWNSCIDRVKEMILK